MEIAIGFKNCACRLFSIRSGANPAIVVKEVKKIKGGEELQVFLNFPAAAKMGENDFGLIIVLPSFTDWGTFRDGYKAANVAKFDAQFDDMASCPDSALWEMIEVK